MQTKPFGDPAKCNIMVVGHDPRLRKSDTIAPYALFADYIFRPKPAGRAEQRKYNLAKSVFEMVHVLTSGRVAPEQVLVTNLCNWTLPHAPRGKTVLIPDPVARRGIVELTELLDGSTVTVVLAMSLQVNYWLQRLGFCIATAEFLKRAAPKQAGLANNPPYYHPESLRAFTRVCGKRHDGPKGVGVYPILHAKSWRRFEAVYGACHDAARRQISDELQLPIS